MRVEVSPGWLRSSGRPEDVGRVDDHHLDAQPRARRERLGLALVLGVRVGEPEPAAAVVVVLGARAVARRRADAGDARGDHHAPHALGRRGLHRDPRRQRVHLPDALGRPRAHVAGAWNTISQPRKARRSAARSSTSARTARPRSRRAGRGALVAVGHAYGSERSRRKLRHVRADESGGACDADASQLRPSGVVLSARTLEGAP